MVTKCGLYVAPCHPTETTCFALSCVNSSGSTWLDFTYWLPLQSRWVPVFPNYLFWIEFPFPPRKQHTELRLPWPTDTVISCLNGSFDFFLQFLLSGQHNWFLLFKTEMGAGGVTQRLRALTALAEVLGSVPRTHNGRQLTGTCNSVPRIPM